MNPIHSNTLLSPFKVWVKHLKRHIAYKTVCFDETLQTISEELYTKTTRGQASKSEALFCFLKNRLDQNNSLNSGMEWKMQLQLI